MTKLKVAVCGTGAISRRKHLAAWNAAHDLCETVAVCDIDMASARSAAAEFEIPSAYETLTELLANERPDIVDIVTPPKTHLALSLEAMEAGAHLLIEKPMAMSVAECSQIVEASARLGREVCVAHSNLFYDGFRKARRMVADGVIGEFRGMRIHLNTPTWRFTTDPDHWVHRLPGGIIGETGPHLVYMSTAFLEDVTDVTVHAQKLLAEYPWSPFDDYRITFVAGNGMSSAMATYTSSQYFALVTIIGSEAILEVDLGTQSIVTHRRGELTQWGVGKSLLSEAGQKLGNLVRVGARKAIGRIPNSHEALVREYATALAQGAPSPVPAEDGLEVVRLLKEITDQLPTPTMA